MKAEVRATLFHRVITFLQHEKEAAPAATTDSAEPAAEAAPVSSEAWIDLMIIILMVE